MLSICCWIKLQNLKTQEVEQAMYLLREVAELLYTLKDETADSMKQIRKNLQFLRSTEVKASTKLDITS